MAIEKDYVWQNIMCISMNPKLDFGKLQFRALLPLKIEGYPTTRKDYS